MSVGIDREGGLGVDDPVARAEVRRVEAKHGEGIVQGRAAVLFRLGVLDRPRRHDEVTPAVVDFLDHDEVDRVDERTELDLPLTAAADRVDEGLLPAVLQHLLERSHLGEALRIRDDDVEGHAARPGRSPDRGGRRELAGGFLVGREGGGDDEQDRGQGEGGSFHGIKIPQSRSRPPEAVAPPSVGIPQGLGRAMPPPASRRSCRRRAAFRSEGFSDRAARGTAPERAQTIFPLCGSSTATTFRARRETSRFPARNAGDRAASRPSRTEIALAWRMSPSRPIGVRTAA